MTKYICEVNQVHEDAVTCAREHMLSLHEVESLASVFKVLSDPTRVRLVWAMKDRELCVCDLACVLGMTKSAISHQLKTMKDAHVVKSRRDGKNIFYSLDDDHVTEIMSLAKVHVSHTL